MNKVVWLTTFLVALTFLSATGAVSAQEAPQVPCRQQCEKDREARREARAQACPEDAAEPEVTEAPEQPQDKYCQVLEHACQQSYSHCETMCSSAVVVPMAPAAPTTPTVVDKPAAAPSYDQRLQAIQEDATAPQSGREHREAVWGDVKELAVDDNAPREIRIAALNTFIGNFNDGNRHLAYAHNLVGILETGGGTTNREHEVLRLHDPRTDTEWVGLNVGVGVYGMQVSLKFVNLRWKHFYWTLLRGSFIGGWMGLGGHWGTGIGVPFFIRGNSRREIRVGLGLEGGYFEFANAAQTDVYSLQYELSHESAFGPTLIPEVLYHAQKQDAEAAFQIGLSLTLYLLNSSTTTDDYYYSTSFGNIPHLNLWAGFTI